MNLTKNIKTHIVVFKDGRQDINITKAQYELLKDEINTKKYNDFITIEDLDTNKQLFNGRCLEIKEFKERSYSNFEYNTICWYGNRHPVINGEYKCDCFDKYRYYDFELRSYVGEKYQICDPAEITSEMRKEFYLFLNNK